MPTTPHSDQSPSPAPNSSSASDPKDVKYRTLFESIDEGFHISELIYDPTGQVIDWRFLEVNPVFEQQTGLKNVVGRLGSETTPNTEPYWLQAYDQVVKTGQPQRFENYNQDTDRWYTAYAARMGGQGSHQFVVVFNDITARKQQEWQQTFLLTLSDTLRPLSNPVTIQRAAMELLGQHLQVSRAFYGDMQADQDTLLIGPGYSRDTFPLEVAVRFSEFDADLTEYYGNGQTVVIDDVNDHPLVNEKSKTEFALIDCRAAVGVPLVKEGKIRAILSLHQRVPRHWTTTEVSLAQETAERTWAALERAKAEGVLQQSEERQRAILESAKDYAIFTTDPDRRITSWSRGAQVVFGYSEEKILNQSADVLFTPEDRQQGAPEYESNKAIREGRAENERWHCRADGSRLYGSGVVTPLRDEAGSIVGLLKLMRDLTVQKKAEEALQQADRRKNEFLAMLAHELRNPMSTIRSGLQILTITDGNDRTSRDTITMMNRQTDHLVRLVDDLLDVGRINQSKIELKKQPLNLVEVVAQAAESLQGFYQEQQRRLQVDLPMAPIQVEGDVARLTQVVVNLLTNGARYSGESGQVWLSLTQQDGPTGRQEALIQVRDNGIGLAATELESIFELFVQVDNSLARSKGGLGLGLTLVKRLVELHGGWVEAQSEGLGKGSTFRVHLPTLNPALKSTFTPVEGSPESRTSAQPPTRPILVVDDNADAALTLSMLLKLNGYEVHIRHSGQSGLEATEVLKPGVVLLDIGMPGLDGYETARAIRGQAWGRHVRLIALTGYGGEEDKQRAKEAGFDGHLIKPVDIGALRSLLTTKMPTH